MYSFSIAFYLPSSWSSLPPTALLSSLSPTARSPATWFYILSITILSSAPSYYRGFAPHPSFLLSPIRPLLGPFLLPLSDLPSLPFLFLLLLICLLNLLYLLLRPPLLSLYTTT